MVYLQTFPLALDTVHLMVQSGVMEVKFLHREELGLSFLFIILKKYPGILCVCDPSLGPMRNLFSSAKTHHGVMGKMQVFVVKGP